MQDLIIPKKICIRKGRGRKGGDRDSERTRDGEGSFEGRERQGVRRGKTGVTQGNMEVRGRRATYLGNRRP